jgi:hypothetical protein
MARAADIGSSFGDSLTVLTSARQAGSGGIALEDPWRQGSLVEATTVVQDVGPRWLGFSVQGGAGPTLRLGADGFYYAPGQITQTTETSAGTYGGKGGDLKVVEWGARFLAQFSVLDAAGWRVAALGRTTGLMQQLPDMQNVGVAVEAGAQAQHWLASGLTLTGWVWVGPLGEGASHGFAGQETIGVGLLKPIAHGLLGGPEGYGVGLEGDWLNAGLLHGSLGATYWIGKASEPGGTYYIRLGVKSASQTAQAVQPRAGIGVLWRTAAGWAVQFDYAFVPIGELGNFNYATLSLRLR